MYQSNIYEYLDLRQAQVPVTTLSVPEPVEGKALLICKDDKEATQIRDVAVLLKYDTFVLPDLRVSVGEDLRSYGDDLQDLFTQLFSYHRSQKKKVLISPLRTLLIPFPKLELFLLKP